ncbi:hypothetical protein [Alkalihalobacillus sp. AL-G]|uniref:hypothetical protein n=1 Tax=Alkalihalobacillus sp. AL-G TaxID=2926399 RepID=UPI00272A134C|nr:hypothetical protein [Alkalihalobacillus sp. AL-G]WLD95272.1 hypothetical protein MOJ78_10480 [Alkalihalobacillus sp. AL-G]
MPYHKDKQQAFQAAQQGYEQAIQARDTAVENSVDYDYAAKQHQFQQEMNEALQQIENALEVASEHQQLQLRQYQEELFKLNQQYDET